ncbi:MAG: hypothetical protein OXE82_09725 [Rhodobacter sp.]|nr:hypothetical protein [Rhodobacter sp.]
MQQDIALDAIGGWLRNANANMERPHRRLGDIEAGMPNAEHLAHFENYRRRYFSDSLLPGRGVEEIPGTLGAHGANPNVWADLEAGVTTLFWSIGVISPGRVVACDLVPEALALPAAEPEKQDQVLNQRGRTGNTG